MKPLSKLMITLVIISLSLLSPAAGQTLSKQEDLKEMGDISSGMSSSIMQLYLRPVLDAFFHPEATVRHFALSGIVLTLSQGLIHPVQVGSYFSRTWSCET